MTPNDSAIAHLPEDAKAIICGLFDMIDHIDIGLGLKDDPNRQAWAKTPPPRNDAEWHGRMRQRTEMVAVIQDQIIKIMGMFPQPIAVMVHDRATDADRAERRIVMDVFIGTAGRA